MSSLSRRLKKVGLAVGDYIDLRVKSELSDTVAAFQANVNVDRIQTT